MLAKQSAYVHLFPSDLLAKDYSTRLVTWLDIYKAEHELGMHFIDVVAIHVALGQRKFQWWLKGACSVVCYIHKILLGSSGASSCDGVVQL